MSPQFYWDPIESTGKLENQWSNVCTVLLESGGNINRYHVVGLISRDVALNVLTDEFTGDAQRLAGFGVRRVRWLRSIIRTSARSTS